MKVMERQKVYAKQTASKSQSHLQVPNSLWNITLVRSLNETEELLQDTEL